MGWIASAQGAWWQFWKNWGEKKEAQAVTVSNEQLTTNQTAEKKGVHILPAEGTKTKGSLETWSEELSEIDAKIKMEEKEIAKMMDKMKSKSTDSLIDMLSKDRKTKDIEKKEVREKVAAIRMLEGRMRGEKEKKSEIIGTFYNLGIIKDKEIKREVYFILRRIQLEEKIKYASTNSLIQTLFDKTKKIEERIEAINVLGLEREDKAKIVPALTKALEDENKRIQMFAALGLYKLGENSIALPVLDRFLKDGGKDAEYIISGVNGLVITYEEGPHFYTTRGLYNKEGARILLKRALNYSESIRFRAIMHLYYLEEEIVYQALIKFLTEAKDPSLKRRALGLVSIKDEKMLEVVKKLSKDKDEEIKEQANKVLEKYYKNKGEEK
ncbi:MAG: HEAT repeat domain-containing protein [bacterium]